MEQIVHPKTWRYILGALLCFVASFDLTWFIQTAKTEFSFFLLTVVLLAVVASIHGAVQLFNKRQLTNWVFVGIAYAILVMIIFMGRTVGVGWAAASPLP